MTKLQFDLKRPAKAKGGDRYEHGKEGDEHYMVIYLPQNLSRKGGMPLPRITITIE